MAAVRGERIKHLRKTLGINQTELSEKLGVNPYQISKYERGIDNPSLDTLTVMAQVFNTSVDYLLGLSNVPHPDAEPEPVVNARERDLLTLFRERSADEQERALRMLHALWDD